MHGLTPPNIGVTELHNTAAVDPRISRGLLLVSPIKTPKIVFHLISYEVQVLEQEKDVFTRPCYTRTKFHLTKNQFYDLVIHSTNVGFKLLFGFDGVYFIFSCPKGFSELK